MHGLASFYSRHQEFCGCFHHQNIFPEFSSRHILRLLTHPSSSVIKLLFVCCSLEEGGQTALGPALLIAVSMACNTPGSKVIMCTDGMANVGLGGLDALPEDPKYAEATEFYDEVSEMAVDKG